MIMYVHFKTVSDSLRKSTSMVTEPLALSESRTVTSISKTDGSELNALFVSALLDVRSLDATVIATQMILSYSGRTGLPRIPTLSITTVICLR